jgi:hypothetical protein
VERQCEQQLERWPTSWSPNLSIRLGSELPTDSKVSGAVLLQKGFDRVCHELMTDRAIKALLEADLRCSRSCDLVGRRYDRARVLFFVGKQVRGMRSSAR